MYSFSNVTDLADYVQSLFDSDSKLANLSVVGEISGFKRYDSGHCYFSLKDATTTLKCVMFKFYANNIDFIPEDGMLVTINCSAGLYKTNGNFQLYCKSMMKIGKGDLREEYKRLFARLSEQGLFDESHKQRLPFLPRKIGVISSSSGAVIHDIVLTLKRRNPFFDLCLYPSLVQGEDAPDELISGIDYFENTSENEVDVIIIARGGGSYEDLFCFNDERLAKRIYDCKIPIISAVGHETDFTICDYVADLRVATPSIAAEVVLPKYNDLLDRVSGLNCDLVNSFNSYLRMRKTQLLSLVNHKALASPTYRLLIEKKKLESLITQMELVSPHSVLIRGYTMAFDSNDDIVRSAGQIKENDELTLRFHDSSAKVIVRKIDMEDSL